MYFVYEFSLIPRKEELQPLQVPRAHRAPWEGRKGQEGERGLGTVGVGG